MDGTDATFRVSNTVGAGGERRGGSLPIQWRGSRTSPLREAEDRVKLLQVAGRTGAAGVLALSLVGAAHAELPGKGKAAPVWSGKTLAGKPISSASLKGRVVLMNFFSYN
jgi:hypothetical protein